MIAKTKLPSTSGTSHTASISCLITPTILILRRLSPVRIRQPQRSIAFAIRSNLPRATNLTILSLASIHDTRGSLQRLRQTHNTVLVPVLLVLDLQRARVYVLELH